MTGENRTRFLPTLPPHKAVGQRTPSPSSKAGTFLWDLPAGEDKHLVILCGAGSLSVNTEHTLGGTDGADFPDAFKPLATLR